ncbi:hypothetical protein ABTN31_19485, partial [Acinetobacter baumannii]
RFTVTLETFFGKLGSAARDAALPLLEKELPKSEDKADELLVAMILDKLGIAQWQRDLGAAYQAQFLEVAKAVNDVAEQAGLG